MIAGRAWQQWRADELDPSRYGLSAINEHGAHWIAGNLRLDFAALNKIEMLPWDVWGVGGHRISLFHKIFWCLMQ